ncbi:PIF1 helicase protein [Rutstroemia sp. NJR-2017a BBW]|nr:PIF1 helicase protein [Rutstroemia sp. NJR-2017a BBW]
MTHIADYMADAASSVGLNNLIARELSVSPKPQTPSECVLPGEKNRYIWRLHQPSDPRRYNIFPAKEKVATSSGRHSPSVDELSTLPMDQGEKDKHNIQRPKELSLNRRRKPSVTDLGPMTTVQENPMDSRECLILGYTGLVLIQLLATIPGRPPVHERSTSAPGTRWRQNTHGESLSTCIEGPATYMEKDQVQSGSRTRSTSDSLRQPLSPKSLTPLVIPTRKGNSPQRVQVNTSPSALKSPPPPEVPPKSARLMEQSPFFHKSPFTPSSSTSASTAPTSVTNTPNTPAEGRSSPKPWLATGRSSPKPWMNFLSGRSSPKPSNHSSTTTLNQQNSNYSTSTIHLASMQRDPPTGHFRNQSESVAINQQRTQGLYRVPSHRRGESESGTSIIDRGRPKKRTDGSPIKRVPSKKAAPTSEEQLAFDYLPQGVRPNQASSKLTIQEMETLRRQALGQVTRFEVLNSRDVDALSRELRALDERCLYLRKTHRSLRAGRRSLHERICTYLRSPRTAKFSHDSILKQEEALAELDNSIDDWVSKLDQAENRRTRVRQKLLEHVAAAVFMQPSGTPDDTTPPRSPIKGISPVRSEVMELKEDIMFEEEEIEEEEEETISKRQAVESIRIYADSDVFALLADVEEEINRMSEPPSTFESQPQPQPQEDKKRFREHAEPLHQTLSAPSSIPSKVEAAKPQITKPSPKSPAPKSPILLRAMAFTMPKSQGVRV